MPRTSLDRFEQRKLTRAKLIDAALQLFSTSGYEHATVDDISQAAGYSKGAYYFHFSTKDDILLELLRMWTEDRTRALDASADDLRAAFTAFLSYEQEPRWPAVLLEFWAQATRNPEVSKRLSQAYATWRRELAERVERAAAEGLRVESADDVAALVLAAHDGHAVQVAIGSPGGRAMTAEALAESLVAPLEAPAEEQMRRTGTI